MASPAVTYTFTNSTVADADEVNTNFADIINSLTDGTKDLSISALTAAGSATLNGNVTLGNASSDDITVTGSLSSSIPIKVTNSYDIGSSTLGLAGAYFGNAGGSTTVRVVSASSISSNRVYTLPDAGADASFVLTQGAQTLAGNMTYTGTQTIDGVATFNDTPKVSANTPVFILESTDGSLNTGDLISTLRTTSADSSNTSGIGSELRTTSTSSSGASTALEVHVSRSGTLQKAMEVRDGNFGVGEFGTLGLYDLVPAIALYGSDGSLGTGDPIGAISVYSSDTSNTDGVASEIITVSESSTGASTGFQFWTALSGTNTKQAAIDSGGNVRWRTSGTTISDGRKKKNISDLKIDTLAKIKDFKSRTFTWIDTNQNDMGFIAQEVHAIAPEVTTVGEDGVADGWSTNRMIVFLVKAVQDLSDKIEQLEEKIS